MDEMEEASLDDLTGATVVTVCGKGGGRSDRAATLLRERGISSARSLCGGTAAWMAAGAAPLGEATA